MKETLRMGKFYLADSHHFSFTLSFPFYHYMKQLNIYCEELGPMEYILRILSGHSPLPSLSPLYTHTTYMNTYMHIEKDVKNEVHQKLMIIFSAR